MAKILKLRGITRHGKNRINEHGAFWNVILDHPLTPAPKLLFIESVQTGDRRWLNENFEVTQELTA